MKRSGDNQTWFPKNWNRKTIKKAGLKVAKNNPIKPDGISHNGRFKKVNVIIKRNNGKIATIYPDKYQKGAFKNEK